MWSKAENSLGLLLVNYCRVMIRSIVLVVFLSVIRKFDSLYVVNTIDNIGDGESNIVTLHNDCDTPLVLNLDYIVRNPPSTASSSDLI